ncbi:uncharacterized protein LOC107647018 [Arachis ipaensis]|uniref:uncharacterized protein LOC107647018 n=1 Tax=Arachis ipaensis TaxID=130454 RepID=UPI0007AF0532|nr:uncharacterized protein LOC107647018 [Arachis ipaensis]XP_025661640.1 uncharacterized protein LOC112757256 [Arachis hypogaea]
MANVVMVRKTNGKWWISVDYINMNKACPKYTFLLPNIDGLVDATFGHQYLSFMDAYFGYNKIAMHKPNKEKIGFITLEETYCYTVMRIKLKNSGATYQRLMIKIFKNLTGIKLKVYIDNILAKIEAGEDLTDDLQIIFETLRKHQM